MSTDKPEDVSDEEALAEQLERERKLLDILGEDAIPDVEGSEETKKLVAESFPDMDKETQNLMARVLQAKMPTPEEIARAEEIAKHNAEVSEKRRIRLAERANKRKRREKRGLKR